MTRHPQNSYNAADPEQVAARRHRMKGARDQELEDIKAILALPAGARFFRRLMTAGRIFQTTFTGAGDSQSSFLEGHRNLALQFFHDLCEAAPEAIADIMIPEKED